MIFLYLNKQIEENLFLINNNNFYYKQIILIWSTKEQLIIINIIKICLYKVNFLNFELS